MGEASQVQVGQSSVLVPLNRLSTIQDYAMGHMCFNIMSSDQPGKLQGFYLAAKAQYALPQADMIPAQIAEAQKSERNSPRLVSSVSVSGLEYTDLTQAMTPETLVEGKNFRQINPTSFFNKGIALNV